MKTLAIVLLSMLLMMGSAIAVRQFITHLDVPQSTYNLCYLPAYFKPSYDTKITQICVWTKYVDNYGPISDGHYLMVVDDKTGKTIYNSLKDNFTSSSSWQSYMQYCHKLSKPVKVSAKHTYYVIGDSGAGNAFSGAWHYSQYSSLLWGYIYQPGVINNVCSVRLDFQR